LAVDKLEVIPYAIESACAPYEDVATEVEPVKEAATEEVG
jgi:hypothetical protein